MQPKRLTDKQMIALRGVAQGMTYRDAGMAAGYTKRSAPVCVNRLVDDPLGAKYLARLRQDAESETIASITERKEILTAIARGKEKESVGDRIRAVDTLNRMDAVYTTQIEVEQHNAVMLVPLAASLDDWTKMASTQQAELMKSAIEI